MDKKLVGLLFVFFLAFTVFSSVVIFNKPITQFTKAKEESVASAKDSLIFAWPLKVASDGKEVSTINVFVRNLNGKPLENKNVQIQTSIGKVMEDSLQSDKEGKTTFHIISTEPGLAYIKAVIDGNLSVTQSVSVKFE